MIELFGSRVHGRKVATGAAKAIPSRTAFRKCSLPEAILELRQGVGRLIRTKQDKGIVVILDPRILTKNYGNAFLRALPKCPVEVV